MGKTYWAASIHFLPNGCLLNWSRGSSGKKVSLSLLLSFCMVLLWGGGTTLCTSIGVISRQLSGCMLLLALGSMAWRRFLFSWCDLFEQCLYFYMSVQCAPYQSNFSRPLPNKEPVSKTARKAMERRERTALDESLIKQALSDWAR